MHRACYDGGLVVAIFDGCIACSTAQARHSLTAEYDTAFDAQVADACSGEFAEEAHILLTRLKDTQILDDMSPTVKGAVEGGAGRAIPTSANGSEGSAPHINVIHKLKGLIFKPLPFPYHSGKQAELFYIIDLIFSLCIGCQCGLLIIIL